MSCYGRVAPRQVGKTQSQGATLPYVSAANHPCQQRACPMQTTAPRHAWPR